MSLFGFKKEEKKGKISEHKSEIKISHSPKTVGFSLRKPLVTEKALILEGKRQYIFEVSSSASKPQIKKDIENLYGVKVESVNTINSKRRARFIRGKVGFNSGSKKAIIKLREGYKIETGQK